MLRHNGFLGSREIETAPQFSLVVGPGATPLKQQTCLRPVRRQREIGILADTKPGSIDCHATSRRKAIFLDFRGAPAVDARPLDSFGYPSLFRGLVVGSGDVLLLAIDEG